MSGIYREMTRPGARDVRLRDAIEDLRAGAWLDDGVLWVQLPNRRVIGFAGTGDDPDAEMLGAARDALAGYERSRQSMQLRDRIEYWTVQSYVGHYRDLVRKRVEFLPALGDSLTGVY